MRYRHAICAIGGLLAAFAAPIIRSEVANPTVSDSAATGGSSTSDAMDEIVVTAQRRSQHLQDVPIAVDAFSGSELQLRQVSSSIDVARMTPGVYASAASAGQAAAYSIRGIVQNDVSDTAEGPIAVYVDDTYSPNVQSQSFALYDLERVEVLKGPQGTLFGRNSTGGLVNFVIAKPTAEPTGFVDATYGSYNEERIEGAASGPLGGALQGRVSIYYDRNDGWLRNLDPGKPDLGGQNSLSARAQLQGEPLDGLKVRVSGGVFRQNFSTAPYNSVVTTDIFDAAGNAVGGNYSNGPNAFGYVPPLARKLQTSTDFACGNCAGVRIYNGGLHVDYELGTTVLSSITNFERVSKLLLLDAEVSPLSFLAVGYSGHTDSFSQEFRATGTNDHLIWNAGAYYLNILSHSANGFLAPQGSLFAQSLGFGQSGVDLIDLQRLRTQSASVFSQIEYNLTSNWGVIVGARGIHEWQDYDFSSSAYQNISDYTVDTTAGLFPLQPAYSNRRSSNLWAGKVTLQYKPDPNLLAYATLSRGVKGGNYNELLPAGGPPLTPSQFPYKPEVLLDYELGAKSTMLNGLLILDAAGYYYKYHDYQSLVFTNLSGLIENRDAKMYGGELQATLKPVRGLDFTLGFSYLQATVENVAIAPTIERNERPPFAPGRQATGRIAYTIEPTVADGQITIAADAYSTSNFFQNIQNFNSQRLPGYTTFGSQLIWKNASGLSLTAGVSNMFDKRYAITGYDLTNICKCSEIAYGKPRWWSVSAGYRY